MKLLISVVLTLFTVTAQAGWREGWLRFMENADSAVRIPENIEPFRDERLREVLTEEQKAQLLKEERRLIKIRHLVAQAVAKTGTSPAKPPTRYWHKVADQLAVEFVKLDPTLDAVRVKDLLDKLVTSTDQIFVDDTFFPSDRETLQSRLDEVSDSIGIAVQTALLASAKGDRPLAARSGQEAVRMALEAQFLIQSGHTRVRYHMLPSITVTMGATMASMLTLHGLSLLTQIEALDAAAMLSAAIGPMVMIGNYIYTSFTKERFPFLYPSLARETTDHVMLGSMMDSKIWPIVAMKIASAAEHAPPASQAPGLLRNFLCQWLPTFNPSADNFTAAVRARKTTVFSDFMRALQTSTQLSWREIFPPEVSECEARLLSVSKLP